ncbi:MAG: hypothetical protein RL499_1241, partial [Actinomycetota bacterium]
MSTPQHPDLPPERAAWAPPSGLPEVGANSGPVTSYVGPPPRVASFRVDDRPEWSSARRWTLGLGITAASLGLIAGVVAGVMGITTALVGA